MKLGVLGIWHSEKCIDCGRRAAVKTEGGDGDGLCRTHVQKRFGHDAISKLDQFIKQREEDDERETYARVAPTIRRIHRLAAPYRKIPPPEWLAWTLIRRVQKNRCLMCLALYQNHSKEEDFHLVHDHDHDTGMVRGLLCRSCNSLEGHSGSKAWNLYRKLAPANGWYYRYSGWGEQWQAGFPDPVSNRIVIDQRMPIDEAIAAYELRIKSATAADLPIVSHRRFTTFGIPILLPGERYTTTYEERRAQNGWRIMPIKADATG